MTARHISRAIGGAVLLALLTTPVYATGDKTPGPSGFSATGSYLAGWFAQSRDDWRAAARFMNEALAADPSDPGLALRSALLDIGEGDIQAALPLADKVLGEKTPSLAISTLVAANALATNRIARGEAIARSLPPDGLSRIVGPLLRAWLAAGRGATEEAVAELEPLGKTPGLKGLHDINAAAILDVAGKVDRAQALYQGALEDQPPMRTVEIAGSFDLRHGRTKEALALFDDYRARMPDLPLIDAVRAEALAGKPVKPVIADARQGLAEALYDVASAIQTEGADTAILFARIALHLRPDLAPARVLIGEVLQDRGQCGAAVDEYQAIANDPDFGWTVQLHVADCQVDLKNEAEAIRLLDKLATEKPDYPIAATRLGDLHRYAKRWTEAVTAYDRAIAQIKTPGARDWGVFYSRAIALDNAKDWTRAEADLKQALKLRPDEPSVLNYLGYSWVDRGTKLDEGKAMIQRAVELRPDDGYIVDSLGWALYRLGDYQGAADVLEHAVESRAVDPTINDHLGDAYWRAGRRIEATFQWERALKFADEDTDKAKIQAKLDNGLPDAGKSATP